MLEKRRYAFFLYVLSLGNSPQIDKRRRNGLHAHSVGLLSTSVYKGIPSTCTLGRGISVPRFSISEIVQKKEL